MNQAQTTSGPILTSDGIPLKVSLKKAERKNKIRAFLLVLPLLSFILITFLVPIGDMLSRSIDDRQINTVFPKTFEVYKKWDRQGLPSEEVYKTMFFEVKNSEGYDIGKASTRMNYSKSGWKSLLKKSKRKFKKIEEGPYKEKMISNFFREIFIFLEIFSCALSAASIPLIFFLPLIASGCWNKIILSMIVILPFCSSNSILFFIL